MKLNTKFVGNSEANRLIIFLHEGLGSIEQWKTFPQELCELTNSYGLIYDREGYGQSKGSLTNRTINYLHEGAEELHTEIISAIHPQYDIYLYGHSDGGSIALIYAAKYGAHIKGIITEAAHVFVEAETIAGVQAARPLFDAGKFDGLKKYHGKRFKEVFFAWNDIWSSTAFRNWEIISLLKTITCPQLVIQGAADEYGTIKQIERIESGTKGHSTVKLIENGGHAPHKEKKEMVLLTVKNWMNGN
ncbi:alpha/beta hydrolase [Crocinitomix sp.]|nr:alpha/beta hydrolase [Crocinitomix sp.]